MNKMLAEWLSVLNQVFAVVFVVAGVIVGVRSFDGAGGGIVGGILGYIAGSLVAVLVCGALAVLLDIRSLLSEIAFHVSAGHRETPALNLGADLSRARPTPAQRAYARADFGQHAQTMTDDI